MGWLKKYKCFQKVETIKASTVDGNSTEDMRA